MWLVMTEHVDSVADASHKNYASGMEIAGRVHSSTRAGIFSMRRANYYNKSSLTARRAGISGVVGYSPQDSCHESGVVFESLPDALT